MADSDQSAGKLIDNITNFIKRERELYGDFLIQQKASDQTMSTDQENTPKKGKIVSESSSPANTQQKNSGNDATGDLYQQIKQCSTLKELEALCRKADVLRTDLKDTQLVFGGGNPDADLMLIGEAPGAEEDKQGKPFVGRAGKLLNKILKSINFSRDEVYVANILKHRPPNNRDPKPEERERSLPFLLRQIELVNPRLILSLGKVSSQVLLDKKLSLSKMRGQFHTFQKDYELLATYHPAALFRNTKWKRSTWEDVQLLRKRYDELGCKP